MKTKVFATVIMVFSALSFCFSQPEHGKMKPPSKNERIKMVKERICEPLNLDKLQTGKVTSTFNDFFEEMEKLVDKRTKPPVRPEKSKVDSLAQIRDEKILGPGNNILRGFTLLLRRTQLFEQTPPEFYFLTPGFYFLASEIYFLASEIYFLASEFYFLASEFYFITSEFYFLASEFYFITSEFYFITSEFYFLAPEIYFITSEFYFLAPGIYIPVSTSINSGYCSMEISIRKFHNRTDKSECCKTFKLLLPLKKHIICNFPNVYVV